MDLHYNAGKIKAFEKLGVNLKPSDIKKFMHEQPGAIAGGAIGSLLAFKTLTSRKEPFPKMKRPNIENNPLLYGLQY